MPIVFDPTANAQIIQQGASDLMRQAALIQQGQQFERDFASDEEERRFRRDRINRLDQQEAATFAADQGLGNSLLQLMMGVQPMQEAPGAPMGPANPMDVPQGTYAGGFQAPDAFGRASPQAQGRYLDHVQGMQENQALTATLQQQLQGAVQEGIIDPQTGATYLQMAQARPQVAPQIMDDLRMARQQMLKQKGEMDFRLQRAQALTPLLQSVATSSPQMAAQVQFLADSFQRGEIEAPAMLRAIADLEEAASMPSPEETAAATQRLGGPNAYPGYGQDMVTARQGGIPVPAGRANVTGRAGGDNRRQAIQDRINVAKQRLERFTKLAEATEGDASARWTAHANAESHALRKAEQELIELGAGGGQTTTPADVAPPTAQPGASNIDALLDSLSPEEFRRLINGG